MQSLGKIAQCAPAVGAKMCSFFLFLPAGLPRSGKLPVLFLLKAKNQVFPSQGRFVEPIQVTLCRTDGHLGPLGCAKFHINGCRGVGMRPPKYQKFALFGRVAPQGQLPRPISKIVRAFIRLTILHWCFKFHVILITGYGVIVEKPRVGKEKECVGSQNGWHLFDAHDELYHHAKFGEDRTTRAGCFCHAPNPEHRAFDGPISTKFTAFLSEGIFLSDALLSSHICS